MQHDVKMIFLASTGKSKREDEGKCLDVNFSILQITESITH
jgi:hypothetical protein